MARKSSVHQLPPEVRAELDRLLVEGRLTLDELRDFICSREGVDNPPSRSAIGRYSADFRETAHALRESREIARGIAQELGAQSVEGEQGRLLVEMLRSLFFRAIRAKTDDPDAEFDAAELSKVARSLRDLSQAMHLEQDYARRIREEERRKVEEEMRARVMALGSAQDLKKLSDADLEQKIAQLAAQS